MATGGGVVRKKERLLQLIECPVCLNEQQDPRLLSCRHALCYTCAKDYTEKNKYDKELPCPVCREVTNLFEGGVDNLPKFFFMNELKEVVLEEDGVKEDEPRAQGGAVCSTEDCGQPAIKYCKDGCQFICQQCYAEHQSMRITRKHQVITASKGEAFTKSSVPPYPPCHRHNHQVMDIYCLDCDQPMCNTCCNLTHDGHKRCGLDQQAEVCKTKLKQVSKDTDELINDVTHAMNKTRNQAKRAETDIDDACDNVRTTFKIIRTHLDTKEKTMLSDLQNIRRSIQKTADVIEDSQMMTLATLQSLKVCQGKLRDKDSPYDYVTVTDSVQRDIEDHLGQQLPELIWSNPCITKNIICRLNDLGKVELKQNEHNKEKTSNEDMKEVARIRLHNHQQSVLGLVVYEEHIYVAHRINFTVYCFTPDGILYTRYNHEKQTSSIQGMCLIEGDRAMLVVCDWDNKVIVWIRLNDDFTMKCIHMREVNYKPCGLYNDRGYLMVCDPTGHKIYRYTEFGEPVSVISLPNDVAPRGVTRQGDGDIRYVIRDWDNHQVVVITKQGHVKTRHKYKIHGVKLDKPYDIITDKQGRVLIVDNAQNQILVMASDGEQVEKLLQDSSVTSPFTMCLEKYDKLYVSGEDQYNQQCLFVNDYCSIMARGDVLTQLQLHLEL